MTQENASGQAVAERVRAADIAVGGNSSVEAMLANSLRERKPLADDGALYDTVQAAENAASSFVFVPPGIFNENVTISTAGLTLLGSGRATNIDGGTNGNALQINAVDVTVESLSVETTGGGGTASQALNASGTSSANLLVKNVILRDSDDHGIQVSDVDSAVVNCFAETADNDTISVTGDRCTVKGCVVLGGQFGINIRGGPHDCIISNNIIKDTTNDGFNSSGADHVIGGNRVHNAGSEGMELNGTDEILYNNRISGSTNSDIDTAGATTPTTDANLTGAAN